MTDPDTDNKSNNEDNEKMEMDEKLDNSVSVPINDIDDSKAQLLINSNGGAGGDHTEVAVVDPHDKSSEDVSFNGLGKDEVMQYANDPFWVRLRWILFILFWVGWFAMLVTAVVIIVVAPRCPPRPDMKWYQKDTVYQVYAKSFKDSGKDGYGDFTGLKSKFKYITDDVGASAVYLNAIFKTDTDAALAKEEMDLAIIDHKELDEKFGSSYEKFKSWIKDLRKKGKKVILDFIPNQTSKKHEWFMKSQKLDKDYKDYYIWAGTTGNAPNDLKNINGESAWSYDDVRKEWYYHSHSKDLPDLNLNNRAVRDELKEIMKFWLKAGVSGFNIQDLEHLVEDPLNSANKTRNNEGTLLLLEELRDIANSYSDKPGRERFLFANVKGINNDTIQYWGEGDKKGLHLVLPLMDIATCDAECLKQFIAAIPDNKKQWLGLQLGNPDTSRIGSKTSATTALKIAQAMQMLLPGTPFNYYGDEFGQGNGKESQLIGGRFNPLNARTPMQWSNDENAGFTETGVTPWISVGDSYLTKNLRVSRSQYNDHSSFKLLEDLIKLRGKESFQWGKTKACSPNSDLLLFTRKAERFPYFLTIVNTGTTDQHPHLPSLKGCIESKKTGTIVFHSSEDTGVMQDFDRAIKLSPGDVVVVEFPADEEE